MGWIKLSDGSVIHASQLSRLPVMLKDENLDLTLFTEDGLLHVATFHKSDRIAGLAMRMLNNLHRDTGPYFWCWDCDGAATSERNCCMNQ